MKRKQRVIKEIDNPPVMNWLNGEEQNAKAQEANENSGLNSTQKINWGKEICDFERNLYNYFQGREEK